MTSPWLVSPIPEIPGPIARAAEEANLVFFVGAGVSRVLGCPSWDELATRCLHSLAQSQAISFGEADLLAHLDAKRRLTIAMQIAQAEDKPIDMAKMLEPQSASDSKVYEYLRTFGCVCVTTNYDRYLDRMPSRMSIGAQNPRSGTNATTPRQLICRPDQFAARRLRDLGAVIHLHGSVDDPSSMVITTPQYLRHYQDPNVQQFLRDLFERHTVLFLGYGLEEREILEYILPMNVQPARPQSPKFMLQGFYSHQERTFKHLERFYRESFDVHLLAYSLDYRDHHQIEAVLEKWSGALTIGEPLLADDLNAILEVVSD